MKIDRRQFLVSLGKVFTFLVVVKFGSLAAFGAPKKAAEKKAAELPLPAGQSPVAADDAVAGAIGYVDDAGKVDRKKYSAFKPGQACAKCSLYTAENTSWGKCQMIAAGLVKSGGWCGSFNAKA